MALLERKHHLDTLDRLLDAARGGSGSLALISGEAGAGKTSVVRDFARRADSSTRVMVGACDALSSPRPLGPLFDLRPGLGEPARRVLRDPVRREDLFHAILDDLVDGEPALVIIEDVHWADEATLDLLRFLGRRIDRARALLAVTYRDDEVTDRHPLRVVTGDLATMPHIHRVKVNLLSRDAVRTLAAGTGVDAEELYRRTDGNPFYVTEVLDAGAIGVPATVRDAVLTRAARLAPDAREALDVAAVIGGRIELWLLAKVAGPCGADAVDACIAGGLLVASGDALQFRHQLAEDAVAGEISPLHRMELHRDVLAALRSRLPTSVDFARLAHHADAAGDRETVLEVAPVAARRAAELGAHREAAAQYDRALRHADHLPARERQPLLTGWFAEAYAVGELTRCIDVADELIELAHTRGDTLDEANWHGRQSNVLVAEGRNAEADEAINQAIRLLERLPPSPVHAGVYRAKSHLYMLNRDYAESILWGERAVELARAMDLPEILAGVLNSMGAARLIGLDEERGRAELDEALSLAHANGFDGAAASILGNLGSGFGEIYRFDQAEHYLENGIAFTADHDLDHFRMYQLAWLALVRMFQGHWDDATALADSVLRWQLTDAIAAIMAGIALGRVRARRGDPEAWDALDSAMELAEPTGTLQRIAPMRAARAEAAWLEGRIERSIEEARAAFDLAVRYGHPWHIGELGYWRWKARDLPGPPDGAAEPYALQMRGDWQGAADAWSARGCPYEAARALAESGDETALRDAFVVFDRLGARPAADMVAQRLREIGATSIPRGSRSETRANPARLTRREQEVLALIAKGCSNGEIATRLYLAPKTIENHVSAILAKLDVSSRQEAVTRASELGVNPFT